MIEKFPVKFINSFIVKLSAMKKSSFGPAQQYTVKKGNDTNITIIGTCTSYV
jgi:hypothetical protein